MTIGGAVCIRNGFELDYPFKEAIESLLPVCDEVCVCDGESTDGTQEYLREWKRREPKLNLCVYPWPVPKGDSDFWVTLLNYARQHLKTYWHFQLDADEVLHEKSYPTIREFCKRNRRSAIVTRWNFWKDHKHTIPDGFCCGKHVIRLGPTHIWMASDGSHPLGADMASMSEMTDIEIFHVGFIRKPKAFFSKEKLLQGYFFNTYDPRLEKAETFEGNWMEMPGVTGWEDRVDEFGGTYPEVLKPWLKERGYDT